MYTNSTPTYSYCEHLSSERTMIQDWADDETDYETAYFGKWHIGPVDDLHNSRFHHTQPKPHEGGPPFLNNSHWHPEKSLGPLVKSMGDGTAGLLDIPLEDFPDVVAARYTQDFLKNRDKDRPFLAYCAFPGPHPPWVVPKEFGLRYDHDDIKVRPNAIDDMSGKPMFQKKLLLMCNSSENTSAKDDRCMKEFLACYFTYLELIDTMVGEVIKSLKLMYLSSESLMAD